MLKAVFRFTLLVLLDPLLLSVEGLLLHGRNCFDLNDVLEHSLVLALSGVFLVSVLYIYSPFIFNLVMRLGLPQCYLVPC